MHEQDAGHSKCGAKVVFFHDTTKFFTYYFTVSRK